MMKKTVLYGLLALVVLCGCSKDVRNEIVVMTYNLRYNNNNDAPHHWDARKEIAVSLVKDNKVGLLGIQEGLMSQINYLDLALTNYKRVGVARDNGIDEGEFSAIYYDTTRFKLVSSNTIWLSETPNEVSQGWDGACKRVMTYAIMEDKSSDKKVAFFNTHFDHQGQVAREESAKLVIKTIKDVAKGLPVIFSGDLNANIEDVSIQYLLNQELLSDSRAISETKAGEESTYHGFGQTTDAGVIDYIMVSDHFKVKNNTIIDSKIGDVYLSDHNPIVATITY